MHILSAIPDNAIAEPIYVPERPERRADTQAEGVAALIALAHDTAEPAPAPVPTREPRHLSGSPLPSAAAQVVSAAPAGLARCAVPVTYPADPAQAGAGASTRRPRRRLIGREGKHRRPSAPPGLDLADRSEILGDGPAGPAVTGVLEAISPRTDLSLPEPDPETGPHAGRARGPEPGYPVIAERRPGPSLAWPTDTVPGFAGPVPGRPVAQEAPRPEFGTVYQPVVDLASDVTVGYQAMVSVAGRWLPGSRPAPPVSTGADVAMEGALTRAAMSVAPVLPGHCWLAAEVSMRLLAADPVLVNGIGALARQVVLVLQQPAVADLDASLWWLLGRLPRNVSLAIGDVRPSRETMNILARLRPAYLRIERDAVVRLENDRARQRHIAALVADAQKYGSRVIASGIETPQERDVLCRLGVHGGVYAGV